MATRSSGRSHRRTHHSHHSAPQRSNENEFTKPTPRMPPKINLSLCGCGILGMYHLGVASALIKHGRTFLENVEKIGGASSGSLTAAILIVSKNKVEDSVSFTYELAKEMRSKPFGPFTPRYSMLKSVHKFLDSILPENAHELASGRLFVSLTNVDTKKNEIISQFESREELVQALMASSYIPFYSGSKPPKLRGQNYMDGGFSNNLPDLMGGRTIHVSPFCGKQEISPDDKIGKGRFLRFGNQDFQVNKNNVIRGSHAFFPPSKRTLQKYFEYGQRDTGKFLRKEGWFEIEPAKPYKKEYINQYESSV